jgi:hypothetical protein
MRRRSFNPLELFAKQQSAERRIRGLIPPFAVLERGVTIGSPCSRYPCDEQENAVAGPSLNVPTPEKTQEKRLDSWKEIAAYLNRDITTVQRWEKREGMPVHRHLHDKRGSVYALPAELDAWVRSRKLPEMPESEGEANGEAAGGHLARRPLSS